MDRQIRVRSCFAHSGFFRRCQIQTVRAVPGGGCFYRFRASFAAGGAEEAFALHGRFKISSAQVMERKAKKGKQTKFTPEQRTIGVPQGGVLSGLLSNLYLSHLDAAVGKCHGGFVRYADDFLVCCHSAAECKQVHDLVEEELKPLKVQLHQAGVGEGRTGLVGLHGGATTGEGWAARRP